MDHSTSLDLNLISALQQRVRLIKDQDQQLGLEILVAVNAGSEEGNLAASFLSDPGFYTEGMPKRLDVTGSEDAAVALCRRILGPDIRFILRQNERSARDASIRYPHSVEILGPEDFHFGDGYTLPAALLDGLLQTFIGPGPCWHPTYEEMMELQGRPLTDEELKELEGMLTAE
jgi:hypothetical protein